MTEINSTNIQNSLSAITSSRTMNTTVLATKILGASAIEPKISELATILKSNSSLLTQVIDLMSSEGGGDEFFTSKGLSEFRAALTSPITETTLQTAIYNKETNTGVSNNKGIVNFSEAGKTIDDHLRDMLGIETAVLMPDSTTLGAAAAGATEASALASKAEPSTDNVIVPDKYIDVNLKPEVYTKLANILGFKDNISSPEFKKRVALLVLAIGTSNVNSIVEFANNDQKELLKGAVDKLMSGIGTSKFWGGLDQKKSSEAWVRFVESVTAFKGVKSGGNIWGAQASDIKRISPNFLKSFSETASTKNDGEVASWVVNIVYDNGELNTPSILGVGVDENGYNPGKYKTALGGFIEFTSRPGWKYDFWTEDKIKNFSNIFDTRRSKAFWESHPELKKYYQGIYKSITGDKELMGMFILDLKKSIIALVNETHDYFWKFWDNAYDKLEALAHFVANRIEAKYGDNKPKSQEEVFTVELTNEILAEKPRIFNAESNKDFKAKVTEDDVLKLLKTEGVQLKSFKIGETIFSKEDDILAYLMNIRYGKDSSNNPRYSRVGSKSAEDVAIDIKKGLDYIGVQQGKEITRKGLFDAMKPAESEGSQLAGSRMSPEQMSQLQQLLSQGPQGLSGAGDLPTE